MARYTLIAPAFDTGSCLRSNAELLDAPGDFEYKAKPFKPQGMRPQDQVRLFEGRFGWFDPACLDGFPERVAEILGRNPSIAERRIAAECRGSGVPLAPLSGFCADAPGQADHALLMRSYAVWCIMKYSASAWERATAWNSANGRWSSFSATTATSSARRSR